MYISKTPYEVPFISNAESMANIVGDRPLVNYH